MFYFINCETNRFTSYNDLQLKSSKEKLDKNILIIFINRLCVYQKIQIFNGIKLQLVCEVTTFTRHLLKCMVISIMLIS